MRSFFMMELALAMAAVSPAAFAQPWPTVQFEVYEGSGKAVPDAAAALARQVEAGPPPLSPALKKEIEDYLSGAAIEFQRMGFPPPELEPIVTRADGRQAYRVYWYPFDYAGMGGPKADVGGVMGYGCRGESTRRVLLLNAQVRGKYRVELSMAVATGQVPGTLDQLTDNGYSVLAHELFHAVQRGTRFYGANCMPPVWFNEGMAEAVGHDMAWRLRRIRSPNAQTERWGLRPYYLSFDMGPEPLADEARKRAYDTSSFWRYLAELERAMQVPSSAPVRPGPQKPIVADAFDYGYLVRLLSSSPRLRGSDQTLDWLDRWLDEDPRLNTRFDHTYADFITVMAEFGRHRIEGVKPIPTRHDMLQGVLLDGCKAVSVDATPATVAPVRFSLPAISARCLRLQRTDTGADPLAVTISAQLAKQDAHALWLGQAGETRAVAASVHDEASHSVASWLLYLPPGKTVDLVVANVAKAPSDSRLIDAVFSVSVPGWEWTGPTQLPPAKPSGSRPRPNRPAVAPATGKDSAPVTQGPIAAQLQREQGAAKSAGCVWPHADAATHCGPLMTLALRRLPRWLAHQDAGFARAPADYAGQWSPFVASRANDALRALDDQEVRIRMPRLEFGFTGTVENVLITVAGQGAEAVSRGPRDVERGSLAYFPASGRVTVDRYDALVFSGSFEGDLVDVPVPNAHRDDRPELPVTGRVQGRFLVGQPWTGDDRYTPAEPDREDIARDITDRLPGSLRGGNAAGPSSTTGPSATGAAGSALATACDCTCAGRTRLMREMERLDGTGEGDEINSALIAKAMCLLQCQAVYSTCPES